MSYMGKYNKSISYEKISQIYDISRASNSETVEKLIKLLHIDQNSIILDMGSGTGNYTAALQQITQFIIGIDISIDMIKQAHMKYPMLNFIYGNIKNLPFNSETFDGIFAIQVLHHVKNKNSFLREAYRILRKEAYIAIHSCSHTQMRAFWFYHYFPKGLNVDLTRIPDVGEITKLLENVGFSNVDFDICFQDEVVINETPESYLKRKYRDSISTFSFLTEEDVILGCKKLQKDIISGVVEKIIQKSQEKVTKIGGSSIIYGKK
ncbi:MAG: class I SAM-dependent methyltransferase [Candidatus Hodarchaeota archaeon]